jgi:hypothetical protein
MLLVLGLGSDLGEPLIELSLAIGNRLLALIEAAELSLVIALRGLRLLARVPGNPLGFSYPSLDLCGERVVTFQGRKRRTGGKTFAGFLAESAALANAFDLCVELAVLGIDLCIAGLFRRLRRLAVPRHPCRSVLPRNAAARWNVT